MDKLLGIDQVAEATGLAVSTLRAWRRTEEGPPSFTLGRRVVYRESDVQAWITAQLERPGAVAIRSRAEQGRTWAGDHLAGGAA